MPTHVFIAMTVTILPSIKYARAQRVRSTTRHYVHLSAVGQQVKTMQGTIEKRMLVTILSGEQTHYRCSRVRLQLLAWFRCILPTLVG